MQMRTRYQVFYFILRILLSDRYLATMMYYHIP